MNKTIILYILILFFTPLQSFAQGFEWANQVEIVAFDLVASLGFTSREVAVDAEGNSYMVGNFVGTQKFGDSTLTSQTFAFQNIPNDDAFVAKYAPDGSFCWVKTFPSTFGSFVHDVELDEQGNLYLLIRFLESVEVNGSTTMGEEGVVLAKLNTTLDLEWQQSYTIPRTGLATIGNLAIHRDAVYLTGSASVELTMSGTILNAEQPAFVASLDPEDGSINWTRPTGLEPGEIDTDSTGNLYLSTNVDFPADSTLVGSSTIIAPMGTVMVFIKYDVEGEVVWTRTSGSGQALPNRAGGLVVEPQSGAVYIVGQWGERLKLEGVELVDNVAFVPALMYVAKFDAQGQLQWLQSSRTPPPAPGVQVARIANHQIDLAPDGGIFIGAQHSPGLALLGEGANEVEFGFDGLGFIVRYSSDGVLGWTQKLRCLGPNCNFSLTDLAAAGGEEKVVFTGVFRDTLDLGELSITDVNPPMEVQSNIYLVKMDGELMSTATESPFHALAFRAWPNPVAETLYLTWPAGQSAGQLELFDLQGRLHLAKPVSGGSARINIQDLPAGSYLLRLSADGQRISQKIIISH
ncbi:MAG: T9SS type A sorting domain-containing protein [Bacteroidota bacterium]